MLLILYTVVHYSMVRPNAEFDSAVSRTLLNININIQHQHKIAWTKIWKDVRKWFGTFFSTYKESDFTKPCLPTRWTPQSPAHCGVCLLGILDYGICLPGIMPTVAFVSLVSCPLWRLSPKNLTHCDVYYGILSTLSFVLVSCPLWRLSPKDLTHCDVYDGLLSNLSFVHCPGILSTFSFVLVSCPLWRLSRYPVHFVLCPGNLPTVAFVLVSCPLWRLSRYPAHFVLCPCILTNLFFVLVSCPRCPLSWYPAHCLVCLPGFLCTVGPTYSICVRLHGVHCAVCMTRRIVVPIRKSLNKIIFKYKIASSTFEVPRSVCFVKK